MKRVATLTGVVALCSLGTMIAVYLYRPEPDRIDAAVRSIGFYPITPPTNLRGPGSIYYVSSDGQFLSMLCEVEHDKVQISMRISPTTKQVSTELKKAKVGFGAQLLNQ